MFYIIFVHSLSCIHKKINKLLNAEHLTNIKIIIKCVL